MEQQNSFEITGHISYKLKKSISLTPVIMAAMVTGITALRVAVGLVRGNPTDISWGEISCLSYTTYNILDKIEQSMTNKNQGGKRK